eukprot:RCo017160
MPVVVTGKVVPIIRGQKIAYMGGKELFLSRDDQGPCLCVPKGKLVRRFPLRTFKLYNKNLDEGKITVEVMGYLGNDVELQISASEENIPQLQQLNRVLSNSSLLKKVAPVKLEKGSGKTPRRFVSVGGDHLDEDPMGAGLGQLHLRGKSTLSEDQLRVVRFVKDGRNVFFTGCAGTGKTYLIKEIVKLCDPSSTFVTASTGIAAVEVGGITLHAFAGIGLGNGDTRAWVERIHHNERSHNYWKRCKLLIIDEISMTDGELFDRLDEVARVLKGKPTKPFGGIQLVLSGDFLQLPPVNRDKPSTFVFESKAWNTLSLEVVELSTVFRQSKQDFVDCLNSIRFGQVTPSVRATLKDCLQRNLDTSDGIIPTVLRALNKDVEQENLAQLDRLPGDKKVFTARDEGKEAFVKLLRQSSLFPDRLELKIGAQVMLLKNLPGGRLGNGTRGVVIGFAENGLPITKFTNGSELVIDRDTQAMEINRQTVASRRQVPLKLAWALTVHKCQGMEIDKLEVSLDGSVFECGQAYTALSRARSLEGLRLASFDERAIRAHPRVLAFYKQNRMSGPRAVVMPRPPQIPISDYLEDIPSSVEGLASPGYGGRGDDGENGDDDELFADGTELCSTADLGDHDGDDRWLTPVHASPAPEAPPRVGTEAAVGVALDWGTPVAKRQRVSTEHSSPGAAEEEKAEPSQLGNAPGKGFAEEEDGEMQFW